MYKSTQFALIIFLGMWSGQSLAQTQKPPAIRLTLADAVRIALKENPQVQNANLDVADRQQDINLRRSALLPQATLQVADRAERINLGSTFGADLPIFPHHVGPFQVFQAGTEFSASVFDIKIGRASCR